MSALIQAVLNSEEKSDLRQFVSELRGEEQRYLLRNDILGAFGRYCSQNDKPASFQSSSSLGRLISYTQEIILEDESLCIIVRPNIAHQETYRLFDDPLVVYNR